MTETATWMIGMGGIFTIITIRSSPGMRDSHGTHGAGRSVRGQETDRNLGIVPGNRVRVMALKGPWRK